MRVLLLSPLFPEYSVNFYRGMASRCDTKVVVDLIQFRAEVSRSPDPRDPNIHLMGFGTLLDLIKMLVLVRRWSPDILHLQEAVGMRRRVFSACVVALSRKATRVVLTVHDPQPHEGRDDLVDRRGNWARDYVRRAAEMIVVHGVRCRDMYKALNESSSKIVHVSTHGVILAPPNVVPPAAGGLELLMFGRMEKYKGLETLLSAMKGIEKDHPSINLTIAGKGAELDRLASEFSRLKNTKVINEFIPREQTIELMGRVHCLVLPYLSATQSGVVSAAFANGRYVIASNVGGLSDVVVEDVNGLLVPPNDPKALETAIVSAAYDHERRQRLCRGACETAVLDMSWQTIAANVEMAYRALLRVQPSRQINRLSRLSRR